MSFHYKYFDGAKWLLIFHQDFTKVGYITIEEAKYCDEDGKYSILSELSNISQYNNVYEFLLEYPGLDYIRWTQTKNPVKEKEINTDEETLGVRYIHYKYECFRGLAISNKPSS